jgi:Uma2 family endonuclease
MTAVPKLTVEDYLAMEARATEKHEFYGGEIVAMSGARPAHNVVTTRLTLVVGNALGSRPCLSFSSDQRVRIDETGAYCYPDLSVVCGRPEFAGPAPDSLLNPDAVFEVLSPTTESRDRGGKFSHFQHLASLRVYALVDPTLRRIEWYTRSADRPGEWIYRSVDARGVAVIDVLGISLAAAEIFSPLDLLEG